MNFRIGQGIDFHRLAEGRDLWLGGVKIPSERGSVAHSDGDVLLHAICDAILGAAGLRDIGHFFPDTDNEWKDADSKMLLKRCVELAAEAGYKIINIDSTICLEKPKVAPFVPEMCQIISGIAGVDENAVSVKATTTEKMGFTGRGEGITALASVLLSS
jgi:2-C-methyl-D-erythritol 2,4-cyclodiphosphate synthase